LEHCFESMHSIINSLSCPLVFHSKLSVRQLHLCWWFFSILSTSVLTNPLDTLIILDANLVKLAWTSNTVHCFQDWMWYWCVFINDILRCYNSIAYDCQLFVVLTQWFWYFLGILLSKMLRNLQTANPFSLDKIRYCEKNTDEVPTHC
jgi:hypothetical protein